MTIEEQVMAFVTTYNELGYLPVNKSLIAALTDFISNIVAESHGDSK